MRAAAYARYSTDNQDENSIAYQMAAIKEYCAQHDITITARYADEAKTGTNIQRADFLEMERAATAGEFEAIVIYDISRGSRDVADWFQFRKDMMRLGIQVISVSGQLGDLMNPNDFLTELINVGMGHHMVLDTRKKSIDGKTTRAHEGVFLGGYAPYGYDIINRRYVINEREARHVRQIFRLYADGKSYGEIMEVLKDQKIVSRHGVPLGKSSLHSILSNERYIGTYIWNEKINRIMRRWAGGKPNPRCVRIEDGIPPIVDKETWERVKLRMSSNKRNGANKAKETYLLSGLIECEVCGSTYVGHCSTNSKGYKTRYYVCGNKYRTRTCQAANINAEDIETLVLRELREYLTTVDANQVFEEIAAQMNSASPDLSHEKQELLNINTQIQNGMKAVLTGLDIPELRDEIDRLRLRKGELEDIIAASKTGRGKVDPQWVVDKFRNALDTLDTNPQAAIRDHITKIYARADGSCTVNMGVHLMAPPVGRLSYVLHVVQVEYKQKNRGRSDKERPRL